MPTGLERPFSKISDGSNNYSVKDSTARNDITTLNTRITNLEIDDLANINITSPTNGQALIYDATSEEWKNGAGGGGNVNEWVGTTSEFEEAIEQGEIADDTNILITNDYSGGSGGAQTLGELADTNIVSPIDGQALVYDDVSDMWKNGMIKSGMLPKLYIHSEAGESQVKATSPSGTVIIATQVVGSTTIWECDAPEFGVYTIDALKDGDDHQTTITVDTVKVYHIDDYHYSYTLSVYAPFGSTVRVSAVGESYTDTGEGDNPVVFGLHQPSTEYTVQVTVDGISESNTVESAATTGQDGDITFTFGTIVLTYADDFKGVNITCTKNETVITKKAPTSNNVMYFYPNDIGTWTISGEIQSGGTFSVVATVESLSTQVYVELLTTPEGSTVTPTDDIQTWLACANIKDKSYTTLAEVLADTETYETLLADSNACDYMTRSTTWATADGKVPTMTSDTEPEGLCFASSLASGALAWKVFDGDDSTSCSSAYINIACYGYKFISSKKIYRARVKVSGIANTQFKVQGSNDGTNYTDLTEFVSAPSSYNGYVDLTKNIDDYVYYQVYLNNTNGASANFAVYTLQFYEISITTYQDAMSLLGKYDYACQKLLSNATWSNAIASSDYWEYVFNYSVPTMTSATTPSGTVSGSTMNSSYPAWKAFDRNTSTYASLSTSDKRGFVQYDFGSAVKISNFSFLCTWNPVEGCNLEISYSDDNSTFTSAGTYRYESTDNGNLKFYKLDSDYGSHRYWKLLRELDTNNRDTVAYEVQFYGRNSLQDSYIPLVPTMTSNTTPSGECFASSVYTTSGFEEYRAFDNNTSTRWNGDNSLSTAYIGYEFTHPVCVNKVTFHPYYSNAGAYAKDYIVQGSNDGFVNDVHDLYSGTHPNSDTTSSVTFNNNNEYLYYRLYLSTTYRDGYSLWDLQFYAKLDKTIIHSAPLDTIYYMDNGSPITLCTTNRDGIGELDLSGLEDGIYILYSSVAKDPSNLSNDYSKAIRITKSPYGETKEMYLMPSNALYWYGNTCDGWTNNGYGYSSMNTGDLTFNTNNILMSIITSASQTIAISGITNAVDITDFDVLKVIAYKNNDTLITNLDLNIQSLSGNKYIGLYAQRYNSTYWDNAVCVGSNKNFSSSDILWSRDIDSNVNAYHTNPAYVYAVLLETS